MIVLLVFTLVCSTSCCELLFHDNGFGLYKDQSNVTAFDFRDVPKCLDFVTKPHWQRVYHTGSPDGKGVAACYKGNCDHDIKYSGDVFTYCCVYSAPDCVINLHPINNAFDYTISTNQSNYVTMYMVTNLGISDRETMTISSDYMATVDIRTEGEATFVVTCGGVIARSTIFLARSEYCAKFPSNIRFLCVASRLQIFSALFLLIVLGYYLSKHPYFYFLIAILIYIYLYMQTDINFTRIYDQIPK